MARAMPVISQSGSLQPPEHLERALGGLVGLQRMHPLEPRQGRDRLRDLGVVFHGARPERVEARVHAVVHLGEPGVVADQVDLGDLRQPGLRATTGALGDGGLRHVERGEPERRPSRARPVHDRPLPRGRILAADRRPDHVSTSANASANRSISSRDRLSVTATASARPPASASGTPARNPRSTSASRTSVAARGSLSANSLKNGAPGCSRSTPSISVSRPAVYAALRRALPSDLDESGWSQPAEVDRGGDGHQRLVRADVRIGLLAADVLLAGLQRQHVAGLAVDVDRLTDDPPGHPADVVEPGGDQPEVRATVVQVVAERLTLRDGDVGAELSGRREHAERERVEHLDRPRSRVVGPAEQVADRLEDPVDVGMLHDDGGHVGADIGLASPALRDREDLRLIPRSPAVGAERVDEPWIDGGGDQHTAAAVAARHVHGLHERGRAVVQRRVRDVEPGQLADHRLELEQRLQHSLGEFRLVGRVRGVELRTAGERPDDARDEVVVSTPAGEAHQVVGAQVARGERAHVVRRAPSRRRRRGCRAAGRGARRPGCRRTGRPGWRARGSRASG